jgi:arylsulfatase A-like enzyme
MTDHGINQNAKGHLYEGGTRSPLLVWGPGYLKSRYNDEALSQMIDIAPTIFELAKHTPLEEMSIDGKSLVPLLRGEVDRVHDRVQLEIGLSRAIVTERYKYLTIRETEDHKRLGFEGRKKLLDKSIKFHREVEGREPHNTDPMAPFGHLGKTPGSTKATAILMKEKPCYFEPDKVFDLSKDPSELNNVYDHPEFRSVVQGLTKQMREGLKLKPGTYAEFKTK